MFHNKALRSRVMLARERMVVQDKDVEGHSVFCNKCGKELPDGSQFCLKCGHPQGSAPTVVSPAVSPKSSSTGRVIGILIGLAVLGYIGWHLFVAMSTEPHAPGTPTALQSLLEHNETLTNSTLTVKPLSFACIRFVVPQNALHVSVDGHFTASGGLGNDIEVFVFAEDGFANFQNGHQNGALFSSLRATQGTIDATLPSGGIYYLVLSNKFSIISSKAVQAAAMLHYMN